MPTKCKLLSVLQSGKGSEPRIHDRGILARQSKTGSAPQNRTRSDPDWALAVMPGPDPAKIFKVLWGALGCPRLSLEL